jgi:bacterioferritin (cytochrome b1)
MFKERNMVDGRQSQQSASEISQGQLINRLNEDLSRHLEAILICVNYCKMVEGNADRNIVERLAEQVQQELRLALSAAEQISSLGGEPTIKLHPVGGPNQTEEMLRSKLESNTEDIRSYLERIRRCEALGEHVMARQIRETLFSAQQYQIYLATSLGNLARCGPKLNSASLSREAGRTGFGECAGNDVPSL